MGALQGSLMNREKITNVNKTYKLATPSYSKTVGRKLKI